MATEVLIHAGIGEVRIAVLRDGTLDRYWAETAGSDVAGAPGASRVGDVILGRVRRVLSSTEAAFVDLGESRAGFLALKDAQPADPQAPRRARIGDAAKEGDALLVQVTKDPIGDKGPRLTTAITLPGRLLVLTPESPAVTVSRLIEDPAERARIAGAVTQIAARQATESAIRSGYVIRTAAAGASAQDLDADASRLAAAWAQILAGRKTAIPPATLYRDPGPLVRILRDDVGPHVARLLVDDAPTFASIRAATMRDMPDYAERIQLFEGGSVFEAHGIEDQLSALADSRVPLPSGGWVSFEHTEALVAVDVNSGRHAGSGDLAGTALAVNLEAADVVARQIRLRGIGGLIVVDFMRLNDRNQMDRVLERLRRELGRDRAPTEISASALGFVALTRKRVHTALDARLTEACTVCDGHGRRRSVETIAREILRRVERAAHAAPGKAISIAASTQVAAWIEIRRDAFGPQLARRGAAHLTLVADPNRMRESFSVETSG